MVGTQNWYLLIHYRTICDSERLERTEPIIDLGLVEETMVHLHNGVMYNCKEEGRTYVYTAMELSPGYMLSKTSKVWEWGRDGDELVQHKGFLLGP